MVSCLGRLDESLLVAAVAHGARSVWLVDGACGDCPQTIGWTAAHTVVARSNALLKAFGVREAITFRPSLPDVRAAGGNGQSNQGVSRRGMMKVLARETARVGEIRAETRQSSQLREEPAGKVRGELPHALPSRRVLLLAGLMRLGIPVARDLNGDGDGLFAQFTLGEGCTACQMCAFFCPTGALTKVEDGDRMGLCFSVAACTNCGLCRDICYRDAVLLSHQVDLNQVLALSVEWQFVQDAHTPPWKDPPDKKVGRQLLKSLGI